MVYQSGLKGELWVWPEEGGTWSGLEGGLGIWLEGGSGLGGMGEVLTHL